MLAKNTLRDKVPQRFMIADQQCPTTIGCHQIQNNEEIKVDIKPEQFTRFETLQNLFFRLANNNER